MIYKYNLTLGDITVNGIMYFARAFDIQGIVREEWLKQNNLLNSLKEYKLITKKAYNEYIKECFPFINYEAELIVKKINKASFIFDIEIRDEKTGEIHSKGWQKICFSKNGKLVAIPEQFKEALMLNKNKYVK
jgi:acyl-CoA thioesterase FadM